MPRLFFFFFVGLLLFFCFFVFFVFFFQIKVDRKGKPIRLSKGKAVGLDVTNVFLYNLSDINNKFFATVN